MSYKLRKTTMTEIIYSIAEKQIKEYIQNFKEWGCKNLHVLADFDRTLTKNFVDGEEKPSLVSVLRKKWILGELYSKKAYELFDTYHPIEVDPNIPLNEKKEKMQEWWEAHMQLLVDTKIQKEHIHNAVQNGNLEFREGVKEFLSILEKYSIPLIIISANALWSDSIRNFFEDQWFSTQNIYIISNGFIWKDGKAVSYTKPVIHTFNKGETVLGEFPWISNIISERKNVVLLGDSLWDPGMIEGFMYENLLKIGFLNKDRAKLEESYKKHYDIIILNDGNFMFLVSILQQIV